MKEGGGGHFRKAPVNPLKGKRKMLTFRAGPPPPSKLRQSNISFTISAECAAARPFAAIKKRGTPVIYSFLKA